MWHQGRLLREAFEATARRKGNVTISPLPYDEHGLNIHCKRIEKAWSIIEDIDYILYGLLKYGYECRASWIGSNK